MFGHDKSLQFIANEKMPPASVFGRPRAHKFNLLTICFNFFVPWFLFGFVFSVLSFRLHYDAPSIAGGLVLCSCALPFISGLLGFRARKLDNDPLWYCFFALACALAIGVAIAIGTFNYVYHMKPFYMIETLNMYPAVNPARAKGSQLMDAGRVYFAKGTGIDMRRAMGFRSSELYCVAPIVIGDDHSKLGSYDFWAVGKNCCSGVSSDFRCGEYNNPSARAGLRLMRDDEREFYRLAVQQAEAAYGIKTTHPLFFHWLQDPIEEINKYEEAGFQWFLVSIFAYFLFNIACVVISVFVFANGSIGG